MSKHISDQARQAVLERDDYTCQWRDCGCRDRENLTLHHITPRALGGNGEPRNLVTLCRGCHNELHKRVRLGDRLIIATYNAILVRLILEAPGLANRMNQIKSTEEYYVKED